MKKRLLALVGILVCVVIAVSLFESDANSQAGTKWTVIGRLVRGLDSARFDGPVIINGTLTHNGNLTGVDKVVADDSLRVGKTSIFNGAMTINSTITLPGSGALKIDSVFYSASNDTLLIAVATKGTFYLILRP